MVCISSDNIGRLSWQPQVCGRRILREMEVKILKRISEAETAQVADAADRRSPHDLFVPRRLLLVS